jgi:DNA (cytosine-5)-methyltransferase 1
MENVEGARNARTFKTARRLFIEAGYGLTEIVLDASRCGVPQRRKRFFCIGHLRADDDFLKARLLGGLSRCAMTVRDYLSEVLGIEHYYRHPRHYDRRAVFSIDEPAPTIRGTSREPAPRYRRHKLDSADPHTVRALTQAERSLIQTFPKDWRWTGKRAEIDTMLGNAVPPRFAAYVGRHLLRYAIEVSRGSAIAPAPLADAA